VNELSRQLAAARPQVLAQAAARARQKEHRLLLAAWVGGALCLAGLGLVGYRAAQAAAGRAVALRLAPAPTPTASKTVV
jgi:hypothetical protein